MPASESIVAVAGRRIDAADATDRRFPLEMRERVRVAIRHVLGEERAIAVVSSAASGADLLALEAAQSLGARTRIILPSDPERFLETSVRDRPGAWEQVFGKVLAAAKDDVVVLVERAGIEGYFAVNRRIIEEAAALASSRASRVLALAIWDGVSRGEDDATAHFVDLATEAGLRVISVLTQGERG